MSNQTDSPELLKARELMYMFSVICEKEAKTLAILHVNGILALDVWDWPHNSDTGLNFWQSVKEILNTF